MGLFFSLGRSLGQVTIPAIRKSKWVWRSLTGDSTQTLESEREFGAALASEFRLKAGLSHEPATLELVREILRRLSGCVRNKTRTFKGEVLLDPAPTAMALPGGFIFMSTGLLDFCGRQPDEIAFVVGHEMGHIIRGHALERTLKRIGAEGLSAILSRGLINPTLRETSLKWLESSHSREQELDADEFGVRVAVAAGYDGRAPLRLFQRLAELRGSGGSLPAFFASHPPEDERIAHAKFVLGSLSGQLPPGPATGSA